MRTKEEIRTELAQVHTDMFKLAHKELSKEEEELWKKLFNKQLTLEKEMYAGIKDKKYD